MLRRLPGGLLLALLVGLMLRLMLWGNLPREGLISDEAEYLAAADWLVQGRGFAWHQGWLWTRAPLYPLFLAAHMRLFGFRLEPIFATQTLLSLVNVVLVYLLARMVDGGRWTVDGGRWTVDGGRWTLRLRSGQAVDGGRWTVDGGRWTVDGGRWMVDRLRFIFHPPAIAAMLAALYLPLAVYPQLVLSETLFLTLLLAGFVLLVRGSRWPYAGAAGLVLGLATLTRGLTLGFLPLAALWLWWAAGRSRGGARRGAGMAALFVAASVAVIAPWSVYASRAYGGTVVVDTTGAFNLLLGARTAYDGRRNDAPTRNFVLALLDERLSPEQRRALVADACLYQSGDQQLTAALILPAAQISQAQRQQLMSAEGLCLIRAAPGAFVLKSLGEFVDLFKINYTGAERLSGGFTLGRLPRWWSAALFLLDDTLYVLVLPLAVLGLAYLFATGRADPALLAPAALIGLWLAYNLATAPLLFAINRFRIPLMPFAFVCAAGLVGRWTVDGGRWTVDGGRWTLRLRSGQAVGGGRIALLIALVLLFIAASPHAYFQAEPAAWASYLGPRPASLASTLQAWQSRPGYLRGEALQRAVGSGDIATARAILSAGGLPAYTRAVAAPLVEALEGRPAEALTLLDEQTEQPLDPWQGAVVRGDLLRRLGDESGAKAAFTPTFVDDQNPVGWAWAWLAPPPLLGQRIDLGGNLDLGYIEGFYLGEGDPAAGGTFRWSGPLARLRFPGAGGAGQSLCLRADGRGWYDDLALPTVQVEVNGVPAGAFELRREVAEYCVALPDSTPGAGLLITLRTPTFVPNAADLLAQQGPQVGQLRRLGVRLDWAEIRGP